MWAIYYHLILKMLNVQQLSNKEHVCVVFRGLMGTSPPLCHSGLVSINTVRSVPVRTIVTMPGVNIIYL